MTDIARKSGRLGLQRTSVVGQELLAFSNFIPNHAFKCVLSEQGQGLSGISTDRMQIICLKQAIHFVVYATIYPKQGAAIMWRLFQLTSTRMAKCAGRPLEAVCAKPMDPNGFR